MNRVVEEDQVSMTVFDYNDEAFDATSDAAAKCNEVDSAGSASSGGSELFVNCGLNKLEEPSKEFDTIKKFFFSSIGTNSELAKNVNLVAIHKYVISSLSKKARADAFAVYAKTVAERNGGNANLANAWFTASRNEIWEILTYGFSAIKKAAAGGSTSQSFRNYICLSPARFGFDSVLSSEVDEYGLRYLMLCRVILGKQELVAASTSQFHPSSEEFDTGVDNLSVPRKYLVWTTYMNSHIQPCYLISFKAPSLSGPKNILHGNAIKSPRSSWISFSTLIAMVTNHLTPSQADCLNKCYRDFLAKKVTKAQLIAKLKEVAGMHVLADVVDLCKKKKLEGLPARRGL